MTYRHFLLLILFAALVTASACGRPSGSEDEDNTPNAPAEPDTVSPFVPTGFNIENNNDSILFTWNDNTEADLAGYEITYYEDGNAASAARIDVGLVNQYAFHDLPNGSPFRFTIRAYDESGNRSDESQSIIETPNDITGPEAPSQFQIREVIGDLAHTPNDYIVLSWTAPSTADLQGIRVVRKAEVIPSGPNDSDADIINLAADANGYTDNDADIGVLYFYKVYAFDEVPNFSQTPAQRSARLVSN